MPEETQDTGNDPVELIIEGPDGPGSNNETINGEDHTMVDLPDGVLTSILESSARAHTVRMQESQMNGEASNNLARLSAVKKFDQIGTEEAAGIARVAVAPPVQVAGNP